MLGASVKLNGLKKIRIEHRFSKVETAEILSCCLHSHMFITDYCWYETKRFITTANYINNEHTIKQHFLLVCLSNTNMVIFAKLNDCWLVLLSYTFKSNVISVGALKNRVHITNGTTGHVTSQGTDDYSPVMMLQYVWEKKTLWSLNVVIVCLFLYFSTIILSFRNFLWV